MGNKPRQYAKKILVALLAFCLAILLCEVGLRVFDYTYLPLKIDYRGGVHDRRLHHAFEHDCFVYDPELIWRPKKDYSIFNSQGFRGRVLSAHKRPGEFRIFALGDSNTLGWEGWANWPGSLAKLLFQQNPEFSVVNAGVYGYTSFQGLRLFKQILPYQPDMVLVSFGSNEAHRVLIPDKEFHAAPFQRFLLAFRIGHLILAARDQAILAQRHLSGRGLVPRVTVEEYRHDLSEIIRICKQCKIQCVLLTRPFFGTPPSKNSWKTYAPEYRAATIALGRENHVPVIDVYAYFKDKDSEVYFRDESHFTQKGHDLAAWMIAKKLQPLLPHPDRQK